jgi:hypothetical protein
LDRTPRVIPHRVRAFAERHWLFLLLLIAAPVVEYLARRNAAPAPTIALVRNPFAAIAAASVFCRYFIFDLRGRVRRWIVYLTPATWIVALAVEGRGAPPALLWLDMLFGLGILGALGFIVAACVASDARAKSNCVGQLLDALLLPLGASMVSYGLWATSGLNPVYDTRIYAFEEILGLKFSVLGVMSYRMLNPISALATACYTLLALAAMVVALMQPKPYRERDVLTAILAAGACGFCLYFVCPVVGPLTAFAPTYPGALPLLSSTAELISAPIGPPRNGMPSLHTIWALLVWFNARPLPSGTRRALRAFVLLTLWAVMGLEDTHWLMDVVVGVPLAVAVQCAFVNWRVESRRRTSITIAVALAMTATWLSVFRLGSPFNGLSPVLAWAAVLGTVCWPLIRWQTSDLTSRDVARATAAGPHLTLSRSQL